MKERCVQSISSRGRSARSGDTFYRSRDMLFSAFILSIRNVLPQYNAFLAGAGGSDSAGAADGAAATALAPRIASFDGVVEQAVNQLTTSSSWGVNTALAFGIGIACMAYSLGHVSGG